jgi:tetratricopeptide (TPR) repeat protein
VYQLADFYVAYQPAPELVWLVADRAMLEAREADDPDTIGGSAWTLMQPLRDAGRWEEALTVANDAMRLLAPHLTDAPDDRLGLWGALQFEVAYVHARRGRAGDAWAAWDRAVAVARRLPAGYRHTQSSFGQAIIGAHAVTLNVELRHAGAALRAANALDSDAIASIPRRSRHLIEVARAYHQLHDRSATLTLLDKAQRTAPETVAFNTYARSMALELAHHPPTGLKAEARDLAARIGLL